MFSKTHYFQVLLFFLKKFYSVVQMSQRNVCNCFIPIFAVGIIVRYLTLYDFVSLSLTACCVLTSIGLINIFTYYKLILTAIRTTDVQINKIDQRILLHVRSITIRPKV